MKTTKWSDEKCVEVIAELLNTRVNVATYFFQHKERGTFEKIALVFVAGEIGFESDLVDLPVPMMPATAEDTGATVQ